MYGIYIHIPFCIKKCNYCDFASFSLGRDVQSEYISKLTDEIKTRRGIYADTVYIGGGTPSVICDDDLRRLLSAVNENIIIKEDAEFTIEVNPATVTETKAKIMKEYGVNRISIGAQSFCDDELNLLGRIHSAEDTLRTYELMRESGFENISMDLMYALPGQSMQRLNNSLDTLLSLKAEHISCYGLKIEEGTPFFNMLGKGLIKDCDEDTFADMYNMITERLCGLGYNHYEISNFAKDGFESKHNLKYWQDKDYIGFGVSASSKEGNRRYTNALTVDEYLSGNPLSEDYTMELKEQMSEFIILALRVINLGADRYKFRDKFGMELNDVFGHQLDKINDYTIDDGRYIKLRKEALLVSNSIMCEFI